MADEVKPTESAAATSTTTGAPQERPQREFRPRPYGSGPRREGGPPREGGSSGPGGPRKFFRRKKVCKFCVEKIDDINYKDVRLLGQFVAESGKITPRRITGVCTPHQRQVTVAIKQARNIALLPYGS